ncbi:tRNA (adenosine(37)-N6)-threonylcarbamoyltransferase complex ATPase subunit type 1 TsaE [Halomonas sp. Bachu 37]|uniref:tRNA (adenosine(37)-N6)-threonylcarbamoyltransferase complex ATPase subunit type 1 TsaE n=1 Tax=Halomonas kashgarensis TaxID=3084920 RepID=UPI003216EF65
MQVQLESEEAQVAFGKALGQALAGRGRVHLEGELGAGKTTLTRGILQAHGHEGAVKSPTYTLVEPYDIDGRHIYHLDLYRLGDPEELEFLGGRDLLAEDALCIIEWASRGEGWLPPPDIQINLDVIEGGRLAVLEAITPIGEAVLARLPPRFSQTETQGGGIQ